ncbi:DUF2513 domain-containing protein [soil metagenome]
MKRDMDLIRTLLLHFEEETDERRGVPVPPVKRDGQDVSKDELDYHVKLLNEERLIETTKGEQGWFVNSLTWKGHEFLDATRDDKIWKKVSHEVAKKGGGFTIDILKALAIKFLNEQLGLG